MKLLLKVRPRVKLPKDERLRRLRLGDLRRLFRDRCRGSILPDDDAGLDYLRELLLPISLGPNEAVKGSRTIEVWGPIDRMRREIELWAPWMPEGEAQELVDEIKLMPAWQRKPKARTLGQRLNVTYGERARLGLRTIGPCDMTEAGMALIRKQKRRQRDKLRRQRKPRAEYLAASLSQTKPWLTLGISRRTWERRRVASVHPINLTMTELTLTTAVEAGEGSKACDRLPTATPAGQAQTYVNDGFLTAEEAAWLLEPVIPASPIQVRDYDLALGMMAVGSQFISWRSNAASRSFEQREGSAPSLRRYSAAII